MRLILASGNPGKIRELQSLLQPLGVELVGQRALGIADAEEPHGTFVENALAKARHAARLGGLPGLADDSGICVPALGGAPGVHSARYAADTVASDAGRETIDAANNRKLLAATAALPQPVACFFYCVIVLVRHEADPCPFIAEGIWHGTLAREAAGQGGFGYDPHFVPIAAPAGPRDTVPAAPARTAAELGHDVKNRVSHRAQAVARLLAAVREGRMLADLG